MNRIRQNIKKIDARTAFFLYYVHMHEVYLDWAATAIPDPFALQLQQEVCHEFYGNPSSSHNAGSKARGLLEQARSLLAGQLDCRSDELYFTAGATEANNMVVLSLVKQALTLKKEFSSYTVVISAIEHASLWEPVLTLKKLGFKVKKVYPDSRGIIRADSLVQALDKQTVMVIVMLINNETGAVQPVAELVQSVRNYSKTTGRKIIFHCDAVQAVGKIPFSLRELNVDSACLSAHKLGAAKGIGALFIKKRLELDFFYGGGGQERNKRPGTENTAGIYSFSKLVEKRQTSLQKNLESAGRVMNFLISELKKLSRVVLIPKQRAENDATHYSPYIISMAFPPLAGEVVVRVLNELNIYISTGSACHSHKKERTRVLESMGVPSSLAANAVRVSIGFQTTQADISAFLAAVKGTLSKLQQQTHGS
ncbi:MAG: cysteine desulfurase [Spirochaetales bacterium]|nr:cysteine desulfurase [Spirochaetales bacterium]